MRFASFLACFAFLTFIGCDTVESSGPVASAATLTLTIVDGPSNQRITFPDDATASARAAVRTTPDGKTAFYLNVQLTSSRDQATRAGAVDAVLDLPGGTLAVGNYTSAPAAGAIQYRFTGLDEQSMYHFEADRILMAIERVDGDRVSGRYSVDMSKEDGTQRAVASGTFEAALED